MTNASSTAAFNEIPPSQSSVVDLLRGSSARVMVSEPIRGWGDTVKAKLNELGRLGEGWNGYGAPPVSFVNANFALRMLESVCGAAAPAPQIVPGPHGDLQIEWHTNLADIELHVVGPNQVHAWRQLAGAAGGEELMLSNDFTVVAAWINELAEPHVAAGAAAA